MSILNVTPAAVPGGSNTQLQFNNAGAFGGATGLTTDGVSQGTATGASGASPGWYAQLTGDTFPRVRVGLNASDIGSIAFGPGSGARDLFLERAGVATRRWGAADAASPVGQIETVQSVVAGTADTAGVISTINDSAGTGTGSSGGWQWQTHPPAGSTGSAQNAAAVAMALRQPAASIPGLRLSRAPFTGGNATTTFPLVLLSPAATTNVTTWSTAGTQFGINAGSGFVGNFLDFHVAGGASVWSVDYTGAETAKSLALGGATIGTDALGVTGTTTLNGATGVSGTITGTSSSASAFAIGLTGATNPAFKVDASTASQTAGLSVTGAATGGTVAVAAIDSGSNTNLIINAKGSGTINIGGLSTGATTVGGVTVTAGAITGVTTLTTSGTVNLASNSTRASTSGLAEFNTGFIGWSSTTSSAGSVDTFLTRNTAASIQLGNADAASPVAQTLRVQSVVAGTAAANGQNWTLIGSLPTGTGTSGDIIFQTGVKTGSGTTQGTPTTALTIKGETQAVTIASGKDLVLGNAYVASVQVPTGYIIIKDSTGTAYKVSCNV